MIVPNRILGERLTNWNDQSWEARLASRNPCVSLPAILEYMKHTGGFEEIIEKVRTCCPHRPCYSRFCPQCAIPDKDRVEATRREAKQATAKSRSHNPRVRGRQSAQPFLLFPRNEVVFVTINFEAVSPPGLEEKIAYWKSDLWRYLRPLSNDISILGRFEFEPFLAGDLDPETLADASWLRTAHKDDVGFKLHIHFLIHFPGSPRSEITRFFQERYGVGHRVNVRSIEDAFHPSGVNLKGIEGLGWYFSKEFTALSGLKEARLPQFQEVIEAYSRISRTQTGFHMGLKGMTDAEARSEARFVERCRQEYDLPKNMGMDEVHAFLMEWDISMFAHGRPNHEMILEEIAEKGFEKWCRVNLEADWDTQGDRNGTIGDVMGQFELTSPVTS